jgi:hypothetical protein
MFIKRARCHMQHPVDHVVFVAVVFQIEIDLAGDAQPVVRGPVFNCDPPITDLILAPPRAPVNIFLII